LPSPGSRNEPDSRLELQPLTGKVEESAGKRSVQAAPRRSRASAQQEASGRRRGALQRPTLPTASRCPPGSHNEPDSRPERQSSTGKGEESAGRRSARAAPCRSRATTQRGCSGRRRGAHFGAQTLPTASHCPARQPQRARFAAGTATINRERWKSIREEVGTSRSLPLTSARTAGRQRSTSRHAPAPYPTHC
jgi:hypothetical protein